MKNPPLYNATGAWKRTIPKDYVVGSSMYIDSTLFGFCLTAATRYIISSNRAFRVFVEYPDGTYADHPDGIVSGAPDEVRTFTGRWKSLRVDTTGDVTLTADFTVGGSYHR